MKKVGKIFSVIFAVLAFAGLTVLSLSLWANKPRGVRIDLNSFKEV